VHNATIYKFSDDSDNLIAVCRLLVPDMTRMVVVRYHAGEEMNDEAMVR